MLQIVRTIFIIFPRPVSTAEDNHTCIQLHHTRRQRTAGIRSCFIGDYIPITLRNRWTEITSLAGKSHRPIHLPIRTPSTREPDGFTSLFLYVRTRAGAMHDMDVSELATRPSFALSSSDVPLRPSPLSALPIRRPHHVA